MTGVHGIDELPGNLTLIMLKTHHGAGDGLAIRDLTNLLFSGPPKPETKRAGSGLSSLDLIGRTVVGLPGQAIRFGRGLSVTKVAAETVREAEEAGELPTYSADRLPTDSTACWAETSRSIS